MTSAPAHASFYTERIPGQFNRALDEQKAAGDEGARVLADMKAVTASMRIIVSDDGEHVYNLNIDEGVMTADDAAAQDPFITLIHDADAFEVLEREAGDSALGFLGGLAGMAGDIKLTKMRLTNLAGLEGSLRFELTGDEGFTLTTHFGSDPIPDEAVCRISVDGAVYDKLRSGEMGPQDAFMTGAIKVEGDMQMAMQLALSVLSPD